MTIDELPPATDQQPGVDRFRQLMSAFPTGVVVVTAVDPDDRPHGMTCSSLASVTLTPPTLLVCLRADSRTCNAVVGRGTFAINLLRAEARPVAELFAAPVADRFGRVRWAPSPHGAPWLVDDAFAMAECRIRDTVEVGSHAVVFGEVTAVSQEPAPPLLYRMRRFSPWCQQDHGAPTRRTMTRRGRKRDR
jgi:flavin reductase (DIM6/NTAB) family NADH-FMN oxidoreductase RutF